MSSPAPAPLPKPSQRVSTSSKAIPDEQSSTGGGDQGSETILSRLTASRNAPAAVWEDRQKDWVRLALVVPVLALLVALLGSDSVTEASISDLKIKPAAIREVLAVMTALVVVKLFRDASRLLAVFRFADIGLELSDKPRPDSYLNSAYVRPFDLFRARRRTAPLKTRGLLFIERTRTILLWVVAGALTIAVVEVLRRAVVDMATNPKLDPLLSLGLAALTATLLAIAAFDLLTILVARWPTTGQTAAKAEWDEKVQRCESWAKALNSPLALPTPWPPLTTEQLDTFEKRIELCQTAEYCEWAADAYSSKYEWSHHLHDRLPEPWPPKGAYLYWYLESNLRSEQLRGQYANDAASVNLRDSYENRRRIDVMVRYKPFLDELATADYLSEKPFVDSPETLSKKNDDELERELHDKKKEFENAKAQHQHIEWCRREVPSLKEPIELPRYWAYQDMDTVRDAVSRIRFARWKQDGSFWSDAKQEWIRFSPVSPDTFYSRFWLHVIAGIRTLAILARHPSSMRALRAFVPAVREQEWLIFLSQFEDFDSKQSG
jgi:hypothetical protein